MGVVQNIMQHWSLTSSRLWSLNKDMSFSSCLVCSLSWRLWADISFWACSRSSTVKAFTPSWLNTHTGTHNNTMPVFCFNKITVGKETAHSAFYKTSNDSHLIQFGLKETFNLVLVRLTNWVKLLHLPWQVPVFLLQTEQENKMLFHKNRPLWWRLSSLVTFSCSKSCCRLERYWGVFMCAINWRYWTLMLSVQSDKREDKSTNRGSYLIHQK